MKTFRPYQPEQLLLLPQDMREWLPGDHLAHFISEVVERFDLSAITVEYERELRGNPPWHPQMMVKLWLYAYCVGKPSHPPGGAGVSGGGAVPRVVGEQPAGSSTLE